MSETSQDQRFIRWSRLYVGALLAFLVLRTCALTEVEAGTVGVRYNNALGLHKQDLKPGFHLEIAGLQRVYRLPSKYLQIDYDRDEAFSVRTKDNNTIQLDVSIPYRIKPGEAWHVMHAGNHLDLGDGKYRFQRFAEQTATSVLREHLAELQTEDFYDTDRRLTVTGQALKVLNTKLAAYNLEARTILIRATYFRDEYEIQLAQIQLQRTKLLTAPSARWPSASRTSTTTRKRPTRSSPPRSRIGRNASPSSTAPIKWARSIPARTARQASRASCSARCPRKLRRSS